MPSLTFVVPGRLDTLTGGYGYDRRIIEGLRRLGWSVDVHEIDSGFPHPTPRALDDAARTLARVADGATVMIDGLAFGAMPSVLEGQCPRIRLIALVHHPLAAESGIGRQMAAHLEASERRALRTARGAVVTSHATAAALLDYGMTPDRVYVVEPGTDRAELARGSGSAIVELLCVATLVPRKGYETLLRALAPLAGRNWRLTCIGSLERDPAAVERLRELLRAEQLEDQVVLGGEMARPALDAQYDRADVFVLPTLYEGYGMVVAEALARGLPVIGTATGAIGELLSFDGTPPQGGTASEKPAPRAGLLLPPGDVAALTSALAAVIGDADLRARLAAGARAVREHLPTWDVASARMAEVIERVQR
jgi:glycosyltransferase involved in cell wall biosynthesis